MLLTPFMGRRGDLVGEVDGILCLFDRQGVQPQIGVEIDVMIRKSLGMRLSLVDSSKAIIPAIVVRPVTDRDVLIHHRGFECSGTMCRTTASVTEESDRFLKQEAGRTLGWITPGLTPVREVGNVNVGWNGQKRRPPVPGAAYVALDDVLQNLQRITGVPSLDEIDPQVLALLVRRSSVKG